MSIVRPDDREEQDSMQILSLIIFLVFAAAWYLPLYFRYRKCPDCPERKVLVKAFLAGMLPAFLAAVLFQCIFGWGMVLFGIERNGTVFTILMNIFGYAAAEETSKFIAAKTVMKKNGPITGNGAVLLFGAVGLGFGVLESFLFISNMFTAVFRGVFSLHVFFQLWMGTYYCNRNAQEEDAASRRKRLLAAFAVPFLWHAVHDVAGTVFKIFSAGSETESICGAVVLILSAILDIVMLTVTLSKVRKSQNRVIEQIAPEE